MAPRSPVDGAIATDRLDSLDVIVELLADADAESGSRELFNGLCQALCRLTSMQRAGLFLYEPGSRIVLPVGSHGLAPDLLDGLYGTLDETPLAQRALAEDRVVEVSGNLERHIPERYAHIEGVTYLTCTPVSTAGRPTRRDLRRQGRRAGRTQRRRESDDVVPGQGRGACRGRA